MEMTFRAITTWPTTPTRLRRAALFKSSYASTLDLLDRELHYLGARQCILEADCEDTEIRLDGQLRSNARLRGPGVILTFESKHGPLRYPCDTYLHWQDNLRAIALALEALRRVDRYGVTRRAEQYRGWKALPGGAEAGNGHLDPQEAAAWMAAKLNSLFPGDADGNEAEDLLTDRERFVSAFRDLAKRLHPDTGGDTQWFKHLMACKDAIAKSKGW